MTIGRTCAAAIVLAIASAGLALAQAAAPAQPRSLVPVDEAATQPDFFAFRAQLQTAIARRDADAVLDVVSPAIRVTFGDANGRAAFEKHWRIRDPGSPLWSELGAVLALGGAFQGVDTFVAPYVFARWPEKIDAFAHIAVIGHNVRVRAKPSVDAPVLTAVSFAILGRPGAARDAGWVGVQLTDGRRGFIAAQFARSSIDHRAFFTRTAGRWLMTLLVAGD